MTKVFITATSWDDERSGILKGLLSAAKKKHGSNMVIMTGYSAIAIKIAAIASTYGFSVQMIAPDISVVGPGHISTPNNITVMSTSKSEYPNAVSALGADGVIAFDKGDPLVLGAIKSGTEVWFPMSDN